MSAPFFISFFMSPNWNPFFIHTLIRMLRSPPAAPRRRGTNLFGQPYSGLWACVGVSVIAADGLISTSCRWSALLFKTCAFCPCCQIVLVFPLCPGSVQFPVPVLRLLGFRFESRIPYVPGRYTAAAHLRPCAAKSDCDPAHASSDSGFMSYLDSHK